MISSTKNSILSTSLVLSALFLNSCNMADVLAQTQKIGLTDEEVISGLKTALVVGVDSAQTHASSELQGFLVNQAIKIALPEDAQVAVRTLEGIGEYTKALKSYVAARPLLARQLSAQNAQAFDFSTINDLANLSNLSEQIVTSINQAASYAAPKAKPIFGNAITSMTFMDAWGILRSSKTDTATSYLKVKTFYALDNAFRPDVKNALDKVSATKYWGDFSSLYNKTVSTYKTSTAALTSATFGVVTPQSLSASAPNPNNLDTLTTNLEAYTTQGALKGMFYLVGGEETKIRENPAGYAEDILQKVFGSLLDEK